MNLKCILATKIFDYSITRPKVLLLLLFLLLLLLGAQSPRNTLANSRTDIVVSKSTLIYSVLKRLLDYRKLNGNISTSGDFL